MRSASVVMAAADRHSRHGASRAVWTGRTLTAVAAACVLAFALLGQDEYNEHMLMWVALNAGLAVGLRLMLLVGETNIATGAFYGMGAYVGAICTTMWGLPFPVALMSRGGCWALHRAGV